MSKRNKGKGIQKADDYKQVKNPAKAEQTKPVPSPTKNTFEGLSNFPPLPYKTVVANPPLQKIVQDSYNTNYGEDICLTAFESVPKNDHIVIRQILSKIFEVGHFQTDHPLKTQKFYEVILVDTKSVDLTHNRDNANRITHSKCTIRDVIGPLGAKTLSPTKPSLKPSTHLPTLT